MNTVQLFTHNVMGQVTEAALKGLLHTKVKVSPGVNEDVINAFKDVTFGRFLTLEFSRIDQNFSAVVAGGELELTWDKNTDLNLNNKDVSKT